MTRAAALAALLIALPCTAAPKLACTQDATRRYYCIDENNVRIGTGKHASLRAGRLYAGTPQSVAPQDANAIVDCTHRIAVLQDHRGVNFAGGRTGDTPVMRALGKWLCEAKSPRPDSKLRQFGQ